MLGPYLIITAFTCTCAYPPSKSLVGDSGTENLRGENIFREKGDCQRKTYVQIHGSKSFFWQYTCLVGCESTWPRSNYRSWEQRAQLRNLSIWMKCCPMITGGATRSCIFALLVNKNIGYQKSIIYSFRSCKTWARTVLQSVEILSEKVD